MTDERMREALEDFRDTILNQRGALAENGMTNDQVNDVLNEFDYRFGEALSPPARRTSTEWKVALWNAIDRWARARYEPGSKSVIAAEKAVVEVHNLIDATLAGLEKEEGS